MDSKVYGLQSCRVGLLFLKYTISLRKPRMQAVCPHVYLLVTVSRAFTLIMRAVSFISVATLRGEQGGGSLLVLGHGIHANPDPDIGLRARVNLTCFPVSHVYFFVGGGKVYSQTGCGLGARGGDIGGTGGTVPPKFDVGGPPMHWSPPIF